MVSRPLTVMTNKLDCHRVTWKWKWKWRIMHASTRPLDFQPAPSHRCCRFLYWILALVCGDLKIDLTTKLLNYELWWSSNTYCSIAIMALLFSWFAVAMGCRPQSWSAKKHRDDTTRKVLTGDADSGNAVMVGSRDSRWRDRTSFSTILLAAATTMFTTKSIEINRGK